MFKVCHGFQLLVSLKRVKTTVASPGFQYKAGCTATENGQSLKINEVGGLYYLCREKGAYSRRGTAFFAYAKIRFSHSAAQIKM